MGQKAEEGLGGQADMVGQVALVAPMQQGRLPVALAQGAVVEPQRLPVATVLQVLSQLVGLSKTTIFMFMLLGVSGC